MEDEQKGCSHDLAAGGGGAVWTADSSGGGKSTAAPETDAPALQVLAEVAKQFLAEESDDGNNAAAEVGINMEQQDLEEQRPTVAPLAQLAIGQPQLNQPPQSPFTNARSFLSSYLAAINRHSLSALRSLLADRLHPDALWQATYWNRLEDFQAPAEGNADPGNNPLGLPRQMELRGLSAALRFHEHLLTMFPDICLVQHGAMVRLNEGQRDGEKQEYVALVRVRIVGTAVTNIEDDDGVGEHVQKGKDDISNASLLRTLLLCQREPARSSTPPNGGQQQLNVRLNGNLICHFTSNIWDTVSRIELHYYESVVIATARARSSSEQRMA